MELGRKIAFAAIALNPKDKTFVVHIASFISFDILSFQKIQLALLKANKSSSIIFLKYSEFVDISSLKLIAKLSKYIKINNHIIDLIDGK